MLDPAIKKSIEESVLCWLATVSEAGEPNVSPKEMFVAYDDKHLLIANIASPRSVKNIRTNPMVCVSLIEIFKQKGYKLTGQARIIEAGADNYAEKLQALRQLGGEGFPVKSIIEIEVNRAQPIIAPSYWLFPDSSEQKQIDQAMKSYGVMPSST